MTEIAHKLIMLKPMQTGASGFARLQAERGRGLAQIHARGLRCKAVRAFWYAGDGWVKELGTAAVNPKGEAAMQTELPWARFAPERLQALLLVEDCAAPRPLLIGLCASQSAGSLLDAKNASLSLCERVRRENAPEPMREAAPEPAPEGTAEPASEAAQEGTQKDTAEPAPEDMAVPAPEAAQEGTAVAESRTPMEIKKTPDGAGSRPSAKAPANVQPFEPPREIFLPAIDPSPYIRAEEARPAPAPVAAPETAPPQPRTGVPVDGLKPLRWPKAFAGLRAYFERLPPCRVLSLPGWRFVCVSRQEDGLWIGYWQEDGVVRKVAYAMRGEPTRDDGRPYQRMTDDEGAGYRVLVQRA